MTERFKKLSASRAAAMGNRNSREIGQEKAQMALEFVYRHGFSTPSIVDKVGKSNRNGLAARLVRAGLLHKTKTAAAGVHPDYPSYILSLTERGRQEIEKTFTDASKLLPPLDPAKINQANLRHDYTIQKLTAHLLASGRLKSYETEFESRQGDEKDHKRPDVVWNHSFLSAGVELELTAKWARDLDTFIFRSLKWVKERGTAHILVISDSEAILARYKQKTHADAHFNVWEKDDRRIWQKTDYFKIGAAQKAFHFMSVADVLNGRRLPREIEIDPDLDF